MTSNRQRCVFFSPSTLVDSCSNKTPSYQQTVSLSTVALSIVDESEQPHVRTAATSTTELERHTPPDEIRALWNTLLASQQILPRTVSQDLVEQKGLGSILEQQEQISGDNEPWVQYFCDLGSSSAEFLPHSQATQESVDGFESNDSLDVSGSQVKDGLDSFAANSAEPEQQQELFVPPPLRDDMTQQQSEKEAFRKIRNKISEAMNTKKIKRAFALFERAVRQG